ncbi:MAG: nuclear transport factor 2 family protein [Silicimonas sp.]|jgi:ketosteroid isomerase-like protein|nr:nuclear transport factor 2 family protein [Silicimonas sp.]
MTTKDIAEKLCEHCHNHSEAQALEELYAEDAVSVEPMAPEGQSPVSEGRDAIKGKHDWWAANFEVHSADLEGPFINGDRFSVIFEIDATDKGSGQRWKAKEVALYEVENGKIARESFFMMPMG